jgi:hypothetical protein
MIPNELWETGAEPVDLTAAHLLWKSPWWAKALESMEDVSISERDFIIILGRLYRDFIHFNKRKLTMPEFADLASMARKVRWKNIGPGFSHKHIGLMRKKLAFLEWKPSIARFEFNPSLCSNLTVTLNLRHWAELPKKAKRQQARRVKQWRKEHKEERQIERLERETRVSNMVAAALTDDGTEKRNSVPQDPKTPGELVLNEKAQDQQDAESGKERRHRNRRLRQSRNRLPGNPPPAGTC